MSNGDPGEQPESSGCEGIMAILRAVETRRAESVVAGLLDEGNGKAGFVVEGGGKGSAGEWTGNGRTERGRGLRIMYGEKERELECLIKIFQRNLYRFALFLTAPS